MFDHGKFPEWRERRLQAIHQKGAVRAGKAPVECISVSRVLIVEDEGPIRNLLLTVCTREGLEAHAADSAEEAMAECTARGFDLVVTDVNMPGADGHDLACWIAARYPQTRVILMSGFDPGACSRCPYVNKCVLVPKPLDLPRFLALVRDVLAAPPRPLL